MGIYKTKIINEGKKSFYHFEFVEGIVCDFDNIKDVLWGLQVDNAISINKIRKDNFAINKADLNYNWRSLFLEMRNQLLEKVIVEINGNIYIYITYINVFTGEIKALKASKVGMYSEELKNELLFMGYKNIEDSFLGNFVDMLSLRARPLCLERKK